ERRGKVLDRALSVLDEERLGHTLAVERETVRLCEYAGVSCEEMRLAALLHDLTRRWPFEKQIGFLREKGEELTEADLASPVTLHGRSAAYLAEECGLSARLCDAVRFHTTGRPGMTREDKILYLADFIEETRPHKVCREARAAFWREIPPTPAARDERLDEAVLAALEGTVDHLNQENRPVHPLTLAARGDLAREIQKGKPMTPKEKAERIARILDEKKGRDIRILHVTDQTVITDYFVICGGGSSTQVKALADEVEYKLREENAVTPARIEGYNGSAWILMDYADVIVHIFDPQSREFYKLEKLWADAEEVPFQAKED
ncbi:MAG: ribosome silencing factor, partial [Clostridia bacterium]|nr:ribosome silencing factor [Clostridia bacterium]